jgi:hypothetical protein
MCCTMVFASFYLVSHSNVRTRRWGEYINLRDAVTKHWRKLHNEELHNLYPSPNVIRVIKWWYGQDMYEAVRKWEMYTKFWETLGVRNQWRAVVNTVVTFGSNKRRVISWLAELTLASQQQLCSIASLSTRTLKSGTRREAVNSTEPLRVGCNAARFWWPADMQLSVGQQLCTTQFVT